MKKHQTASSTFLGVDDFYVSAFDVSARTAIENGVSGMKSLELLMSESFNSKQKWRGESIAIDLGANIGRYSIFFARSYLKVYAIEAHPLTFRLLSLNTESLPNVHCSNFAASDSPDGVATIQDFYSRQSPRASIEPLDGEGIPTRSFKVRRDTVDRFLHDKKENIGLIKVDVEGHDLQALIGAEKTIRRFKPDIIFELNRDFPKLLQTFSDFGYARFFAPNTEVLAQFKSKKDVLKWCLSRTRPIQSFIKLYSKPNLFEFTIADLPLSELVLASQFSNLEN